MGKTIHIGRALTFPAAELSTLVIGVLGNRGSGKSNTAFRIIEGQLDADIPVIVLDYVGIYWSLRLDETGKHASRFHLPVLGGPHGDITLVPSTGGIVAEALAKGQSSAVLDVSSMSKADRCRFATDFAEAFFSAKKSHPGPVQLWLEESQRFIPQKLFHGQERMLGAFEEIAEVGRNYGIGLGLISQRPQKISKDVLNLADVLIAFRMNGVLERKAIGEWVQEKDADGREAVKDELPGLERGEAIVWSPSVFETYGRFKLDKRSTYDVNATPLSVRKAVKIKALDLKELEAAMGAAVEQAKANDPRVLKARVAELEKQLKADPLAGDPAKWRTKTIEKSVLKEADIKRLEKLADRVQRQEEVFTDKRQETAERIRNSIDDTAIRDAQMELAKAVGVLRTVVGLIRSPAMTEVFQKNYGAERPRQVRAVDRDENGAHTGGPRCLRPDSGDLPQYALDLLNVVAQRGRASDAQISTLSGYRRTSSAFPKMLGKLTAAGLIEGTPRERVITAAGRERAGTVEALPTGRALLDHWLAKLTGYERLFLKTIHDAGPLTREELAERTDRSMGSSAFPKTISALVRLALIEAPRGGNLTIAESFQ